MRGGALTGGQRLGRLRLIGSDLVCRWLGSVKNSVSGIARTRCHWRSRRRILPLAACDATRGKHCSKSDYLP